MIVYADVLIVLNLIVDYFLLRISSKILNIKPKTIRILASSLVGALFSLYIFLPQSHIIIEFFLRFIMSSIMVLICFSFKNMKHFLKGVGVLFTVTCLYAGVMIAFWQIMKPNGMIINNSVVYFDISPVILIAATVIGYFIYMGLSKMFASSSKFAQKCEITISADGRTVGATAIIDTGNSISDIFGNSEIIIADKAVLLSLFGNLDITENEILQSRFRTVPCGTVSGGDILEGFRCDTAKIIYGEKTLTVKKPVVAISKMPLSENYSAILNPKILNAIGEENGETEKLSV